MVMNDESGVLTCLRILVIEAGIYGFMSLHIWNLSVSSVLSVYTACLAKKKSFYAALLRHTHTTLNSPTFCLLNLSLSL